MKEKVTDGVLQTLKQESRTARGATTQNKSLVLATEKSRPSKAESYKEITSLYVRAGLRRNKYKKTKVTITVGIESKLRQAEPRIAALSCLNLWKRKRWPPRRRRLVKSGGENKRKT